MKLVWHLFRKDLARVKIFAAALLLLVALRPLLGVFAITRDGLSTDETNRLATIDGILLIAHVVGAWLLTLWLALLDSPRRPDAFLHTRPVSRRALWSAKLLGALALCAVAPLLALLPWWLGCGMAGADLRALLICHVFGLAAIVVSALTVAALVRDYRRAVLYSIAVAIVAMCLPVLFSHSGESRWRYFANRDWVLRFDVWLLFGVSVVFALLGLLYRRHPRWTGFVAWAAASLSVGVAFHHSDWPAPIPPAPPRDPLANVSTADRSDHSADDFAWTELNAADFADLRVELTTLKRHASALDQRPIYTLKAQATGLAGLIPHIEIGAITFTAPNGDSVRFRKESLFSNPYEDIARLFNPPPESSQPAPAVAQKLTRVWDREQALRLDRLAGPLTVSADLRVTLLRPELALRHPVEPTGWRHAPDGTGYRIRSVRETTEPYHGLEIQKTETEFDSAGPYLLWRWLERPRIPHSGHLSVFNAQGIAVGENHVGGGERYTVAGVSIDHNPDLLQMPWIKGPDGKWTTPPPTPDWRAGLTYAAIDLVPVARVSRQLTAADIAINRQK